MNMTTPSNYILPAGSRFSAVVDGKPTGLAGCDNSGCELRGACLRSDPTLLRVAPHIGNDLHEPYPMGLDECRNFILRAPAGPGPCQACHHGLGFNCRTCWPAR